MDREKRGRRVGFTDAGKRRDIVQKLGECKRYPSYHQGWGMHSSIYDGKQLSVIIPVQNEEETIEQVILEARKIEPLEIIVVVNGSTDQTVISKRLGVTIIEYNERLGHNVGRLLERLKLQEIFFYLLMVILVFQEVICIILQSGFSWCRHSIK